jgi:hypothetical protein
MKVYHKIQSIYKRDPATKFKRFLEGDWSVDAFGILQDIDWTFTEKVDGTNIRVGFDGEQVSFGGRSDNADIPKQLLEYLTETFTPDSIVNGLSGPATLVGEGYGGKIQKGSGYQEEQRFILFDVFIEPTEDHPLGIWLEREAVESIAEGLNIPVVPVLFKAPLLAGVDYVKNEVESLIANDPSLIMEGVVARPCYELRDRLGRRIITKIKVRDYK